MSSRLDILDRVIAERNRQLDLPGNESDMRNTPNEWLAIAGHYLFNETRKGPNKPSREAYEDSLIKAAAVILAALEHCEIMKNTNAFVSPIT